MSETKQTQRGVLADSAKVGSRLGRFSGLLVWTVVIALVLYTRMSVEALHQRIDNLESAMERQVRAGVANGRDSSVTVVVSGLRNNDGQVMVSLYRDASGFPGGTDGIVATKQVDVENGKAVCVFEGIEFGDYAVAAIHDEDADGKLKTNAFGIPKEGTGASNDAKSQFGPPKWKDAVFPVDKETVQLEITIQYL